jgi:D-psicose/D-tagatose/L-ribulose 3-epimerase
VTAGNGRHVAHWKFPMPRQLKHAMCNEAFESTPFVEQCRTLKNAGYEGIEIAPFTLAPNPVDITPQQRQDYRRIITDEGLQFVGLHWLMVSPKGLHVTTPDADLRARSWTHIRNLIDLGADLGENGVMVFGSPQQRSTTGGLTREQATRNYIEGLASVAPQAEQRGVTVLVEALPAAQSDVVQTLEEAVAIVQEINSPAVRTMFDTHNAVDEIEPHPVLVERYFQFLRHVHVNEMDGRYPGTANYDFGVLLKTLMRLNYQYWVSLEVFDFKPSPAQIAQDSLAHLAAGDP